MAEYNWLDFIIFGIIFLSFILGLARGLYKEIISILVLCLALVITIRYTNVVGTFLSGLTGATDVASAISTYTNYNASGHISSATLAITLLVLFGGTFCIGEAVNFYFPMDIMIPVGLFGLLFRLAGGALGLFRGYIFAIVFIILLALTPLVGSEPYTQSVLVQQLHPQVAKLSSMIFH